MSRRRLVVLSVASLSIAIAVTARRPSAIAAVDAGDIREVIVARALVAAENGVADVRFDVRSDVGARVLRVAVHEGDHVEPKQVLAEIERPAEGTKAAEQAEVTAPIRGVVVARRIDVGDSVAPGADPRAAFEIADTSRTELRVEVEEEDAPRVAVGLPVSVRPSGGGSDLAHGHIARIAPRVEPRGMAMDPLVRADGGVRVAWVEWEGARPDLPLGLRLEARIELPARRVAARVPRRGVHVRDGRAVVDEIVGLWTREVPVEIRAVDEDFAELAGVAPGTRVALDP